MVLYGICILVFGIVAGPEKPKLDLYHLIALVAGITGALGFLYFFLALSKGPATVVIPLTSLYVAVSSILALLILSEPLTLKKGLGIISAVLAMILLTG
jgi:transporter family protein